MAQQMVVAIWLCGSLGLSILVARLVLGRIFKVKWDIGDSLTAFAIVIATLRLPVLHIVVTFQTNNVTQLYRDTNEWTPEEIHRREIGAKFALVSRNLYIFLLWTLKLILLIFYQQLVKDMPWGKKAIRALLAIFAVTWIASTISTFVECRPFYRYWQVIPNAGTCSQAVVQLFVVGMTNIFTDILLICLPIPILLNIRLSTTKKLQLGLLFSIGFIIVIITAIRLPFTVRSRAKYDVRLLWTTIELLAAIFVANAPKLYGLKHLNHRRRDSIARELRARSPGAKAQRLHDFVDRDLERNSEPRDSIGIYHVEDISNYGDHGAVVYHGEDIDEAALVGEKQQPAKSTFA